MAKIIAHSELSKDIAKVIDAVTAGETVVITRNGEPAAELRPLQARCRAFIPREEVAALVTADVRIEREQLRADLDGVIDQSL